MKTSEILERAIGMLNTAEQMAAGVHCDEQQGPFMYLCCAVDRLLKSRVIDKKEHTAACEHIERSLGGALAFATTLVVNDPDMSALHAKDRNAFYIEVQRRKIPWAQGLVEQARAKGD